MTSINLWIQLGSFEPPSTLMRIVWARLITPRKTRLAVYPPHKVLTDLLTLFHTSSLETAFLKASGVGCEYLSIVECPRSFDTVAKSTPDNTSLVANVCLRSWNPKIFNTCPSTSGFKSLSYTTYRLTIKSEYHLIGKITYWILKRLAGTTGLELWRQVVDKSCKWMTSPHLNI